MLGNTQAKDWGPCRDWNERQQAISTRAAHPPIRDHRPNQFVGIIPTLPRIRGPAGRENATPACIKVGTNKATAWHVSKSQWGTVQAARQV